jgi:hypothetical protein
MNKFVGARSMSCSVQGGLEMAGGLEEVAPTRRARQGGAGPVAEGLTVADGARRARLVAASGARLRRDGAGPIDGDFIVHRLEEAGATLLALPSHGYSTAMRTTKLDIVRVAIEAYGQERARLRAPMPDSARIGRMDEALGWIPLIPLESFILRRIVGARALVSPITQRHLFSWRRLAEALGADHKAVQRWHAQGVEYLVRALNQSAHGGDVRSAAGPG